MNFLKKMLTSTDDTDATAPAPEKDGGVDDAAEQPCGERSPAAGEWKDSDAEENAAAPTATAAAAASAGMGPVSAQLNNRDDDELAAMDESWQSVREQERRETAHSYHRSVSQRNPSYPSPQPQPRLHGNAAADRQDAGGAGSGGDGSSFLLSTEQASTEDDNNNNNSASHATGAAASSDLSPMAATAGVGPGSRNASTAGATTRRGHSVMDPQNVRRSYCAAPNPHEESGAEERRGNDSVGTGGVLRGVRETSVAASSTSAHGHRVLSKEEAQRLMQRSQAAAAGAQPSSPSTDASPTAKARPPQTGAGRHNVAKSEGVSSPKKSTQPSTAATAAATASKEVAHSTKNTQSSPTASVGHRTMNRSERDAKPPAATAPSQPYTPPHQRHNPNKSAASSRASAAATAAASPPQQSSPPQRAGTTVAPWGRQPQKPPTHTLIHEGSNEDNVATNSISSTYNTSPSTGGKGTAASSAANQPPQQTSPGPTPVSDRLQAFIKSNAIRSSNSPSPSAATKAVGASTYANTNTTSCGAAGAVHQAPAGAAVSADAAPARYHVDAGSSSSGIGWRGPGYASRGNLSSGGGSQPPMPVSQQWSCNSITNQDNRFGFAPEVAPGPFLQPFPPSEAELFQQFLLQCSISGGVRGLSNLVGGGAASGAGGIGSSEGLMLQQQLFALFSAWKQMMYAPQQQSAQQQNMMYPNESIGFGGMSPMGVQHGSYASRTHPWQQQQQQHGQGAPMQPATAANYMKSSGGGNNPSTYNVKSNHARYYGDTSNSSYPDVSGSSTTPPFTAGPTVGMGARASAQAAASTMERRSFQPSADSHIFSGTKAAAPTGRRSHKHRQSAGGANPHGSHPSGPHGYGRVRESHDNTPQDKKYLQTNPFSMYSHNKTLLLDSIRAAAEGGEK